MTFLKNTRDRINADYAELVKEFPELLKEPEKLMETLSPEESLALRYLYIAMPVNAIWPIMTVRYLWIL